ncbi:MAG TPA: hypothetical protein VN714_11890 [Trebonia sp.]|nr:hypothetical protein [Trebonia sp.]
MPKSPLSFLPALSSLQDKAAKSPLYRKADKFARKHSRVSMIAAATAAAGVLGTAGFAAGAAPWEQAFSNVAKTAQGDSTAASGQLGGSLFQAIAGGKASDGKPLGGGQLDIVRSAQVGGNTAAKQQAAAAQAATAERQKAAQQKVAQRKAAQQKAAQQKAAAQKAAAQRRAAAQPYRIYDSVKPETIPSGKAAAVYANGAYAAFPRQLSGHNSVLWIDTNGSDPAANVLDVEPGDATPAGAAQWVKQRLSKQPRSVAIVYTMRSEWQQVKNNVDHLPGWMRSKVRYWIADPTGVDHVVPGASATQWYWGNKYDVTTANPDFVG